MSGKAKNRQVKQVKNNEASDDYDDYFADVLKEVVKLGHDEHEAWLQDKEGDARSLTYHNFCSTACQMLTERVPKIEDRVQLLQTLLFKTLSNDQPQDMDPQEERKDPEQSRSIEIYRSLNEIAQNYSKMEKTFQTMLENWQAQIEEDEKQFIQA